MDTIAVDLPCLHPGHERVPLVIRAVVGGVQLDDSARAGIIRAIEQQQLDAQRGAGVYAEVGAAIAEGYAEGMAAAAGNDVFQSAHSSITSCMLGSSDGR
jgi:hypothetical protein